MERRKFLFAGLALTPVALSPLSLKASGRSTEEKKPFTVKAGKARTDEVIFFKGINPNDCKISGSDTADAVAVFEYTGFAKTGPSMHLHYTQDEIFYVTEGEYRFVVGDETSILKAGDTIFLPRNIPHTWIQLSDKGKMLYQVQPAGKMEEFFRLMNSFKSAPTREEVDRIHEEHGMKSIGPGLTL